MRQYSYCFLLIALLCVAGPTLAQTGRAKDVQLVGLADEVYRNSGARRQALDQYLLALQANPDNIKANYMAGICYLQTIQKERSLAHFLHVYDLAPGYDPGMNLGQGLYPDLLFLIGQAYHFGENFDRASDSYRRFAAQVRGGRGSRMALDAKTTTLKTIERRLFECETGKQLTAYPVAVSITPVTALNSAYPDYAPATDKDESVMVFSTRRPGGPAPEVDQDLFYFEDVYLAERSGDTGWATPHIIPGVTTERHEASVALSADGRTLILYKDENGGDLFVSRRDKDNTWSRPRSIGSNINSGFRESSAFISADGKRLYFASDRPGGFGGSDIYYSDALDGDRWGVPSNLGPALNTEYDDESPVFSFDSRFMYFSSKGHRGMGGYDIFRTHFDSLTREWAKPENMGYPINTADNDLFYIQGNDLGHAYFASARETGTGDLDIYLIRPQNPADSLLIRGPKLAPIDRSAPHLVDDGSNLLTDSALASKALADTSQSSLADEFAGKRMSAADDSSQRALAREFDQMNRDTDAAADRDSAADARAARKRVAVPTHMRLKLSVIDRSTGRLLDVKLDFRDEAGGEVYTAKRLKQGTYIQQLPSEADHAFLVSAEKAGYQFRNITVKVRRGEKGLRVLERVLEMEPIALNRPRVLRNLYFDFDKVTLKSESHRELGLLENLLRENPTLIIEVAGHTDFVGTEAYNQQLSERRAKVVVAYLRRRGIEASRLRAKGYGKRLPIASNDDEREGRELNRRTEFEVIGGRVR